MSRKEKLVKIGLPIVLLLAGAAVMSLLIKLQTAPEKKEKADTGALVELLTVHPEARQVQITGTGTAQPRREISITPQVSGRIASVAPHFVAGGFFGKDELLFAIEAEDYVLGVERARAALAKAELDLASIESRAKIARAEWEELKSDDETEANPLVLYEPQLKEAQSNLVAAHADLKQAELNLARTEIRAPFNCLVRSKQVDIGQYVKAGDGAAVVAGTDRAEIIVPLSLNDLSWLVIPEQDNPGQGSAATVRLTLANRTHSWPGRLARALGDIDPQSRMARVVVAVPHPYARLTGDSAKPDLAPGMFVKVTLHGKTLKNVFAIPRKALREGATVWLMDNAGKLRVQPVTTVRQDRDEVLISKGLKAGDRVVLTNLAGAANGMLLRPAKENGQ